MVASRQTSRGVLAAQVLKLRAEAASFKPSNALLISLLSPDHMALVTPSAYGHASEPGAQLEKSAAVHKILTL